ncbi:MAG: DUF6173 family protein [Pseudomonadota bacterium]
MDEQIRTTAELREAIAIPRKRDVHTDEGQTDAKVPEDVAKAAAQKSPAQWAYERLILYIQNFEKMLDKDHEVAMGFTDTGAGVLRIEGMGFFDPDIVTFYGTDHIGARTQLVQHVSQLNVLLRALPKPDANVEARRIGFQLARELEDGKA